MEEHSVEGFYTPPSVVASPPKARLIRNSPPKPMRPPPPVPKHGGQSNKSPTRRNNKPNSNTRNINDQYGNKGARTVVQSSNEQSGAKKYVNGANDDFHGAKDAPYGVKSDLLNEHPPLFPKPRLSSSSSQSKPDRPELPKELLQRGALSSSHLQQVVAPPRKHRKSIHTDGSTSSAESQNKPVLAVKPVMKYWPSFSSEQTDKSENDGSVLSENIQHLPGSAGERSPDRRVGRKVKSPYQTYTKSPTRVPLHQTEGNHGYGERAWTEAEGKENNHVSNTVKVYAGKSYLHEL